jgi:hypothetical protein
MANLLDTAKKEQQGLAASVAANIPTASTGVVVPPGQTTTPTKANQILLNLTASMAAAKAKQGGIVPPAVMPVVAPVVQAAPVVIPPVAAPAPAKAPQQRTPWHIPGCSACKDSTVMGYIFANGGKSVHPCQTCEAMATTQGLPTSKDYKVWVGPKGAPNEGVVCFQLLTQPMGEVIRGDAPIVEPEPTQEPEPQADPMGLAGVLGGLAQAAAVPAIVPVVTPTETVTPGRRKRRTKEEMAADAAKTAQQAPVGLEMPELSPSNPFSGPVETPPVSFPGIAEPAPEESPAQGPCIACNGEPGFNLLIGCNLFVDGKDTVITADEVLAMAMGEIATVAGKPLAAIPHFDQMAAIDSLCPSLSTRLKNLLGESFIVAYPPTKGTAMARLLDGLRPYAKRVIVAIAG